MPEPEAPLPEVYIQPGESQLVKEPTILRTLLGSCVGIAFRVPRLGLGALCHPMLPRSPAKAAASLTRAAGRRYERALREMQRVLRPGGLLVAVEPANRSGMSLCGSLDRSPDDIAEELRFYLTCERGRVALGEGDNSIGDWLAGLVASLGLSEVEVRQWEHTSPLFAPYAQDVQRAVVAEMRGDQDRQIWVWDRETTCRYFVAGGGLEATFDARFQAALSHAARVLAAIDAGTFHASGGSVVYVVSGRKG